MAKDDIYELTVRSIINQQNVVNVHHFKQSQDDGSGSALDALDEIWNAAFKTEFLELLVDTLQVVDISIRRIKPTQTQPTVFAVGSFGTTAIAGLPTHCCAIVRQQAQPDGRKGTGHVKIPAPPITAVESGRVNAAYATLLNTYAENFEAEQVATSGYRFDPSVYSQVDNVARKILKARGLARVKTCHSRQIGVGA